MSYRKPLKVSHLYSIDDDVREDFFDILSQKDPYATQYLNVSYFRAFETSVGNYFWIVPENPNVSVYIADDDMPVTFRVRSSPSSWYVKLEGDPSALWFVVRGVSALYVARLTKYDMLWTYYYNVNTELTGEIKMYNYPDFAVAPTRVAEILGNTDPERAASLNSRETIIGSGVSIVQTTSSLPLVEYELVNHIFNWFYGFLYTNKDLIIDHLQRAIAKIIETVKTAGQFVFDQATTKAGRFYNETERFYNETVTTSSETLEKVYSAFEVFNFTAVMEVAGKRFIAKVERNAEMANTLVRNAAVVADIVYDVTIETTKIVEKQLLEKADLEIISARQQVDALKHLLSIVSSIEWSENAVAVRNAVVEFFQTQSEGELLSLSLIAFDAVFYATDLDFRLAVGLQTLVGTALRFARGTQSGGMAVLASMWNYAKIQSNGRSGMQHDVLNPALDDAAVAVINLVQARDVQIQQLQAQLTRYGMLTAVGVPFAIYVTPFILQWMGRQGYIPSEMYGAANTTAEYFVALTPAAAIATLSFTIFGSAPIAAGVGALTLAGQGVYKIYQTMPEKDKEQIEQNLRTALLEASELAPAIPRTLKRVMQAGELALLFTIGATALAYTPVFSASKNFLTRSRRTPLKKKNASTQKRKLR